MVTPLKPGRLFNRAAFLVSQLLLCHQHLSVKDRSALLVDSLDLDVIH